MANPCDPIPNKLTIFDNELIFDRKENPICLAQYPQNHAQIGRKGGLEELEIPSMHDFCFILLLVQNETT